MNVLVTGGAGYVGSHCVRALEAAGHTAWVADNLCKGHRAAVLSGRLIQTDLHDRERLQRAMQEQRIEAVMHFAAFCEVGESVLKPAKYYQNNVVGTLSLLEAMRHSGVTRIVFSSTTAVYGTPKTIPIREDFPREPINPYGFTKLVIEKALQDYAAADGLAFAALRYFNAAGASSDGQIGEDHDPESHLIPLVLQVALGQRQEIAIFGEDYPTPDGSCVRDYVHVEDLADAHLRALDRLQPGKGMFLNLGTGHGQSVRQVIEASRKITGHPIPARSAARRPGDPAELIADSSLARSVLGWSPKYMDLEGIVSTAWNWHQSHPNGYGD